MPEKKIDVFAVVDDILRLLGEEIAEQAVPAPSTEFARGVNKGLKDAVNCVAGVRRTVAARNSARSKKENE